MTTTNNLSAARAAPAEAREGLTQATAALQSARRYWLNFDANPPQPSPPGWPARRSSRLSRAGRACAGRYCRGRTRVGRASMRCCCARQARP